MPTKPPSSPFDRRRWTEQEARVALAALERSGKSVGLFAAEQGVDPQRLYSWRRRLSDRLGGAERTTFRELIVRPSPRTLLGETDATPFEIVLASGVVVRVPPSFDAAALARLLEVLVQGREC
jgi:transposase-like protein